MSWSITRTGTPEEVGDAIKNAILQSANYSPPSPRRSLTAELVANNVRSIIVGGAAHPVGTGAKQPVIVGYSSGHISDDGSLGSCSMSFGFVREEPRRTETAPGPDAVTGEEVDATLSGAGIREPSPLAEDAGFGDLNRDSTPTA